MSNHLTLQRLCQSNNRSLSIPREYPGQYIWAEDQSVPLDGTGYTSNVDSLTLTQFVPPDCIEATGWELWPHPLLDGSGTNRPGEYADCDDWYITKYCVRAFIFTCVWHDGLKFHWEAATDKRVLNLRHKNYGFERLPYQYPYVTDCWNFRWATGYEFDYVVEPKIGYVWVDITGDDNNTFRFYKDGWLDDVGMDPIMNLLKRRYGSTEEVLQCIPAYTPLDIAIIGQTYRAVRKKCLPCKCYEHPSSYESQSSDSTSSTSTSSSSSLSEVREYEEFILARDMESQSSHSSESHSSRSSQSKSSSSSTDWTSQSLQSEESQSTSGHGIPEDHICHCDSSAGGDRPWFPKGWKAANNKLHVIIKMCNKGAACSVPGIYGS